SFSPDGEKIATASGDYAFLWEVATHRQLASLDHQRPVYGLRFGPDGHMIATSSGNIACLWEAATCKLLASLKHRENVTSMSFSPDGYTLGTCDWFGECLLWDASTGKKITSYRHRNLPIDSMSFSLDAHTIATFHASVISNKLFLWKKN